MIFLGLKVLLLPLHHPSPHPFAVSLRTRLFARNFPAGRKAAVRQKATEDKKICFFRRFFFFFFPQCFLAMFGRCKVLIPFSLFDASGRHILVNPRLSMTKMVDLCCLKSLGFLFPGEDHNIIRTGVIGIHARCTNHYSSAEERRKSSSI